MSRSQPMTETFPTPWKSTSAAKASNFGAVAARITSLTPDPANPGKMTQVTIAKVFGGLQDDRRTAEELAALIVEAVNNHEALKARIQELEAELAICRPKDATQSDWNYTGPGLLGPSIKD
jgi:hypothetical protein